MIISNSAIKTIRGFVVGQRAVCIEKPIGEKLGDAKGAGWIEGMEFTIKEITRVGRNYIIWPVGEKGVNNNCGIYIDWVSPICVVPADLFEL